MRSLLGRITLIVSLTACAGDPASSSQDDGPGAGKQDEPDPTCDSIAWEKELLITDLGVVEDPVRTAAGGAWTFGRLMEQMAGAHDPARFTLGLFEAWLRPDSINSFPVSPRSGLQAFLDAWPRTAGGELDLTRAPLRLLAIVGRMDLRQLSKGNAGEGRFVFGVVDAAGEPLDATFILEYHLLATTQADVEAWARDWHALGSLPLASAEYNDALQRITDRFAGAGVAPGRPNGSALGQLRTNEQAFAPPCAGIPGCFIEPWELREFRLTSAGEWAAVPVERTPDRSFDNTELLRDFVNEHEAEILAGTHTVPLAFHQQSFLGASITNDFDSWGAEGIRNNEARHKFSLETCNGCHGEETTTEFAHIRPRPAGTASELSIFLLGGPTGDPVTGEPRDHSDLARRAEDLRTLACPTSPDVDMDVTTRRSH